MEYGEVYRGGNITSSFSIWKHIHAFIYIFILKGFLKGLSFNIIK